MAINWRGGGVFVVGLLLGAVGAAMLVGQGRDAEKPPPAAAAQGAQLAGLAAGAPQVDCSFAPMVAKAGPDDGSLPLDKDLQAPSSGAISALILSGKESAAAGKARDAEVAFLMACRSAEGLESDPVPLADAQYQLGRHYAQLASVPGAAKREELLRRAEGLYAASVQAYRQHRGDEHEKTRFAAEGLARLQALKAGPPPTAAEPAVAAASAPAAADDTRISGAPAPAAAAKPTAAAPAATKPAPAAKAPATQQARSAPEPAAPPAAAEAAAEPPATAQAEADAEAAAARAAREERQARREAQEAREAREAREEREAARAAREVQEARAAEDARAAREAREAREEARQVREREREEQAERAARRAAERDRASELGASRAPDTGPPPAPAKTVITEPPATATGDIQ